MSCLKDKRAQDAHTFNARDVSGLSQTTIRLDGCRYIDATYRTKAEGRKLMLELLKGQRRLPIFVPQFLPPATRTPPAERAIATDASAREMPTESPKEQLDAPAVVLNGSNGAMKS